MENLVHVQLAGSEIHGFYSTEDLDLMKMMEEASARWLRPNEIHAMLYNYNLFTINVKPVHLPKSGTIVFFDRKMLRNFRRDGHNWKKKKDGKTVKEAHEHLKVGNEERIHVYYAHGEDNPGFVRRCYWLLDKKYEHIVLVHYRETLEIQGSPVTPVNSSSSGSTLLDTSASRILLEETDSGANHAFHLGPAKSFVGESDELGNNGTVRNHEMRLHEINTLEWEELLVTNDSKDFNAPIRDDILCLEQQHQYRLNESQSHGDLPSNNIPEGLSSFANEAHLKDKSGAVNVKLPVIRDPNNIGNQTNYNIHRKDFEMVTGGMGESMNAGKDNLHTQDSFGRWVSYIMTDSPGSLDDLSVGSPISAGQSSSSTITDHQQSSIQGQIFSITDVSPAWAFSAEETKVVVIGCFPHTFSHLAESNLLCVFGDICVPAEMVQTGVFRCMALPHTPGPVNLYLSFDGHTPISQVMTFEYRASPLETGGVENNSALEEFQVQIRLARLLFSTNNCLNILSSKVAPSALREAKKFQQATSSVDKDWAYLMKSIGKNEISFTQAKNSLFEITLKSKLQEWLLGRVIEGGKIPVRDRQGQGILHLCAILGYTWAVRPYSHSGLSLDFRDTRGWTALHWAAFHGREKMVAVLLSAGANPSLVADPNSEFSGGCTAADLASKNGYDGLSAYLAEKGLTEHFRLMALSGNISGSLQVTSADTVNPANLSEEQLCQKDSLTAYRTAAEAASRIQSAFRENALKLRTKAVQYSNPEDEARNIVAAMRIQHAFRNHETKKKIAAAARIQHRFRTWKVRNDFLNLRRQTIKIQAAFRGLLVRRNYRKILWSVGVLEKAIFRWRLKRKGLRGLQVEEAKVAAVEENHERDVEEEFFKISRKQAEERIERSVVRVQSLFRSFRAQQEYRRMKMAYDQVQLEELLDSDVWMDG